MAAVKKASFASRQLRAGPAPLASFEDLPCEELESPNNSQDDPDEDPSYPPDSLHFSLATLTFSEDSTPGTITGSPVSTLHINITMDPDSESQNTLTPCDLVGDEACSRMVSVPSVPKLEIPISKSPDNLLPMSPDSLKVIQDESQITLPRENSRKGSWTDIFKSRSRSRSHSPQPSPQSPSPKALPDLQIEPVKETEGKKKKGKLMAIFKFHDKKSHKSSKSPVNPEAKLQFTRPEAQHSNSPLPVSEPILDKTSVADAVLAEKSLSDVLKFPESDFENGVLRSSTEDELVTHGDATVIIHPELSAKLSLERKSKSLDLESVLTRDDFHGSSESELAVSETLTELKGAEREVDFEAETLLAQDSMEYEEMAMSESSTLDVFQTQAKSLPRRQRLEIITVPIERPRSTTPISVAPFEAFIQSAQLAPALECKVEKLKVLLPGEQFNTRLRSPKKAAPPKSWQDFCHSGLHSPSISKKPQLSEEGKESLFSQKVSPFGDDWVTETGCFYHKWEAPVDVPVERDQPNACPDNQFSVEPFTLSFNCLSSHNMVKNKTLSNSKRRDSDWSTSSSSSNDSN